MTPKRRREYSPSEIEALHDRLDIRLRRFGLETQPKVAARVLELVQNPDAQLRDYAEAIRADWSITGRLLRMANSAFYAQRTPVTKVERALVVLGTERTKAIALGFYLSRLAPGSPHREFSRALWGESVYRATLCSQLARTHCPHLSAEAFVVGLMLDCGQPLMAQLVGDEYLTLVSEANSPGKLFALEYDRLECTHIDIFSVLARRWKLPRLLTRPVIWHHTLPPVGKSSDPTVLLHRLAYYVGALQLSADGKPKGEAPLATIADRLFEISSEDLNRACRAASAEYDGLLNMFDEVAKRLGDVESVSEAVHAQLVDLLDEQLSRSIRLETRGGAEKFSINGQTVEIEPGRTGEIAAYISSDTGQRLLSCTINPNKEEPEVIARLLGLDEAPAEDISDLIRLMRAMAA